MRDYGGPVSTAWHGTAWHAGCLCTPECNADLQKPTVLRERTRKKKIPLCQKPQLWVPASLSVEFPTETLRGSDRSPPTPPTPTPPPLRAHTRSGYKLVGGRFQERRQEGVRALTVLNSLQSVTCTSSAPPKQSNRPLLQEPGKHEFIPVRTPNLCASTLLGRIRITPQE